jgi:hypothetical protein
MGVLIRRTDDADLYKDAYKESQRIIRISDEVRISLERVANEAELKPESDESFEKLTSSKLAQLATLRRVKKALPHGKRQRSWCRIPYESQVRHILSMAR